MQKKIKQELSELYNIEDFKQEKFTFVQRIYELSEFEIPDYSEIVQSPILFGYRNKMEYPFYALEDESLMLAEYKKGSRYGLIPFEGSPLAHPKINKCALSILKILNDRNIRKRSLKGLQMRYSWTEDKVTAILFVKDEEFQELPKIKEIDSDLKCLITYYSTHKSPAYVMTKKLYSEDNEELTEKILDNTFIYPFDGFFQINLPLFEDFLKTSINYLKQEISIQKKITRNLIDLYCGVGTIGISIFKSLTSKFTKLIGLEYTPSAEKYFKINAEQTYINYSNYEFTSSQAERSFKDILKSSDVLILDPPRAGCHINVTNEILEKVPEYIIYLSCNPESQLKDLQLLISKYNIELIKTYDFFPNTNHLENLVILKRKLQ